MTICPGQLKFAGTSTSPSAQREHSARTSSSSAFSRALMPPGFFSATSQMMRERTSTSAKASSSEIMPESASALICPRENPATAHGSIPRFMSVRPTAIVSVAMAACAARGSAMSLGSSDASNAAMSRPNTSEAQPTTRTTVGSSSRSAPMPGFWDPCPGQRKTVFSTSRPRFSIGRRVMSRAPPSRRLPGPSPAPSSRRDARLRRSSRSRRRLRACARRRWPISARP